MSNSTNMNSIYVLIASNVRTKRLHQLNGSNDPNIEPTRFLEGFEINVLNISVYDTKVNLPIIAKDLNGKEWINPYTAGLSVFENNIQDNSQRRNVGLWIPVEKHIQFIDHKKEGYPGNLLNSSYSVGAQFASDISKIELNKDTRLLHQVILRFKHELRLDINHLFNN